MSRGLGKVQRAVLEALTSQSPDDPWVDLQTLAQLVWGAQPSRSQYVAVHRAANGLTRISRYDPERGRRTLVHHGSNSSGQPAHFALERYILW